MTNRFPSSSIRLVVVLTAAAIFAPRMHAQDHPAPDTSVEAVVAAARAYVHKYQDALTFLLADEKSTQVVTDVNYRKLASRTMDSEMFFVSVPEEDTWLAIRQVTTVDGAPVKDPQDVRALLASKSIEGVAKTLKNHNAQFNIGAIQRNFGEPTFSLLVLNSDDPDAVAFERKGVKRDGDSTLVTIGFTEKAAPTLINSSPTEPLYSTGEFVVDAGTGQVRHAELEFHPPGFVGKLTTDYKWDARLELWLPSAFAERYDATSTGNELVVAESKYSNFRRFGVEVHIK